MEYILDSVIEMRVGDPIPERLVHLLVIDITVHHIMTPSTNHHTQLAHLERMM